MPQRLSLSANKQRPFALRSHSGWLLILLLPALMIWGRGLVMAELPSEDALFDVPDAITWPMSPGESLNQLAALFYPNNKPMQRRLLADNRGGERTGFSQEVLEEILLLQGVWEIREPLIEIKSQATG